MAPSHSETLVVAPVQWSHLNDIDAIKPINDDDADCLVEIREVLRKHGKLERFGVALLHSHFPLDPDEVMLEETDEETRTLTLKPVKQSQVGKHDVGTIWMLRDGVFGDRVIEAMAWCKGYCKRPTLFTGHKRGHRKVK